MLGFAVVQAQDDQAAVWLVSRTETHLAGNTNAVVFDRADARTLAALTDDRLVLADPDSSLVAPDVDLEKINELLWATFELRDDLGRRWKTLRLPDPPVDRALGDPLIEQLVGPLSNDLPHRTLVIADGVRKAWTFWLATEQVRHRKVTQLHAAGKAGDLAEPIWSRTFVALPASLLPVMTTVDTVDA